MSELRNLSVQMQSVLGKIDTIVARMKEDARLSEFYEPFEEVRRILHRQLQFIEADATELTEANRGNLLMSIKEATNVMQSDI